MENEPDPLPEKDPGKYAPKDEDKRESSDQPPRRGPSKKVLFIAALLLAAALLAAFFLWRHARQFTSTDDAYTTAHVHQVSARVAGTVAEVLVDDNQPVRAGEVIVRLDPRDAAASLAKARAAAAQAQANLLQQKAAVEKARAQVASAEAQVEKARAMIIQSEARFAKAKLDYERNAGLFARDFKAVSKADVDAVTAALQGEQGAADEAKAGLSDAAAQAQAAQASLGAAEAQVAVAAANIGSARADVQQAELQFSYCEIKAPVAGRIAKKTVESGQCLSPGQALLAVVAPEVWILANLKETDLGRVQAGQRVDIKIDALADRKFFGTVESIQQGSGATFSLLPPDNATGNFTKIVQRVPVKIVFDPESIRDFRAQIVPGLSVVPRIDLESLKNQKREPARQQQEQKQNAREEKRE